MTKTVVRSKIGTDGILHLALPFGIKEASQDVEVTVTPLSQKPAMSQEEWRAFIQRTAGSWKGDFVRPEQGEFEEREPL